MPLPDFQSFLLPALRVFADGKPHGLREAREYVSQQLQLDPDSRALLLADRRTPVYVSRTDWAITYLHRAGALARPERGVYQITERGRELLGRNPERLTAKQLMEFPEFREFVQVKKGPDPPPNGDEESPEERLANAWKQLRESLAKEILDKLRQVSPAYFEKIVVDLLVAMGYGGSVEDAASVLGRAGDEGIDGMIKEDKLGLDAVYVQAKRWSQNVGRPEVQAFAGSLEGARARKGVFITTSDFTPDAREYVKRIEKKIVLIDGRQLAELMIDHDVGVTVAHTYKLKRLDSDYFEEE
jgi:restriction system protein